MPIATLEVLPDAPPWGRELLQRLGLRGLHCGCGHNLQPGWLNTDRLRLADEHGDATGRDQLAKVNDRLYYLEHDASRPFPFEDSCFEWVYAEHFIEHVSLEASIAWLGEVRRLLQPGGLVRLSTPDLRRYVKGYLDPEAKFFEEHRRRLLAMGVREVPARRAWMVNQIFRHWGHQWLYDVDEVRYVAARAGFDPHAVTECRFQQGTVPEVCRLDLPLRSDESLYVEITRT